jgi:hypothetical protein
VQNQDVAAQLSIEENASKSETSGMLELLSILLSGGRDLSPTKFAWDFLSSLVL